MMGSLALFLNSCIAFGPPSLWNIGMYLLATCTWGKRMKALFSYTVDHRHVGCQSKLYGLTMHVVTCSQTGQCA